MERLTKRLEDGRARVINLDLLLDSDKLYELIDRLAAYEDTGLEPEEIKELCTDDVAELAKMFRKMIESGEINHLQDLLQAEKDGRLVALDEPMRPLIWGDKEHDTVLCPRCLCDLMGGFEFAP